MMPFGPPLAQLVLPLVATFLWMVLLDPFRVQWPAVRLLVALAIGIVVALVALRVTLWFQGTAAIITWAGGIATVGAFAVVLKKVLDR